MPSHTYVNPVVKYLLFSFNFLFWIIGMLIVGIGLWSHLLKKQEQSAKTDPGLFDYVFNVSIVFMAVGIWVFLVAFGGCLGALRENTCLLKMFYYLLMGVFLVMIGISIAGFIFYDKIENKTKQTVTGKLISRYYDDPDLQNVIDFIQITFKCCGITDEAYLEWSHNKYFNCTEENKSSMKCSVPYSCCINRNNEISEAVSPTTNALYQALFRTGYPNALCGKDVQSLTYVEAKRVVYSIGCVTAILRAVHRNLYTVSGIAIGVSVFLFFGLYLARLLIVQVEDQRARYRREQRILGERRKQLKHDSRYGRRRTQWETYQDHYKQMRAERVQPWQMNT